MKNEGPFAPGSADLFSENAKTIRAQIAAISFRQLLNTELDELARAGELDSQIGRLRNINTACLPART
jgi:hypothetical protein